MMTPETKDKLTAPFWKAAEAEQLKICCCETCKIDIWYPQEACPQCGGQASWRTLSGKASLLSWTTVRRQINDAFDVPYTPAIVVPDDAPTVQLVTQLFLDDDTVLCCDMPLQVAFRQLQPLQGKPFIAPIFVARE